MAIIKIIPVKDTTINSQLDVNKGLDEILELGVDVKSNSVNRILLAFDSTEINSLKTLYSGSTQSLNLFFANAHTLPYQYGIELYQIANSNWLNGIGNSVNDDPLGVRWSDYMSTYDSTKTKITEIAFDVYKNKDLYINPINSSTYSFMLNIKNDLILVSGSAFSLQYFSKDTHTIYSPTLDFKFDDTVYNNSLSGSVITKDSFTVSLKNNVVNIVNDSVYRINIGVRYTYPERNFFKSSIFNQRKFLPSTAYYSIRDVATNIKLIDFDNLYTRISLDTEGNFFNLYTKNFEPNRYYSVDLKVIINGYEHILTNTYIFKLHEK